MVEAITTLDHLKFTVLEGNVVADMQTIWRNLNSTRPDVLEGLSDEEKDVYTKYMNLNIPKE